MSDKDGNVSLNVDRRQINDQEMNTNLRITNLDRQIILTQIKELKECNEEVSEEELQTRFKYLYENLPIMFNSIRSDPTMPMDIIEKMVNTVYLLGTGQVDPMQARLYIGHLLHDRYTNVRNNES